MHTILIAGLMGFAPIVPHYYCDPSSDWTPVLPSYAVPKSVGGQLESPPAPVGSILMGLARDGRTPGDVVVAQRIEKETVKPVREFRGIGNASVWKIEYRIDIVGPDGPTTVYYDRVAIIRMP